MLGTCLRSIQHVTGEAPSPVSLTSIFVFWGLFLTSISTVGFVSSISKIIVRIPVNTHFLDTMIHYKLCGHLTSQWIIGMHFEMFLSRHLRDTRSTTEMLWQQRTFRFWQWWALSAQNFHAQSQDIALQDVFKTSVCARACVCWWTSNYGATGIICFFIGHLTFWNWGRHSRAKCNCLMFCK